MPKLILIALGGSLGALSRYALSGLVQRWISTSFPVGTLVVNALGCLVIGMLMGLAEDRGLIGPYARWFFAIGFLGSFTTLSTMSYETVELLNDAQLLLATLNVVGNCGAGLCGVLLGRLLVRAVTA